LTAQLCASSPLNLSHSSTFNLPTKEPGLSRRVLLYPSGVACFRLVVLLETIDQNRIFILLGIRFQKNESERICPSAIEE
jgi:hypothetical protein